MNFRLQDLFVFNVGETFSQSFTSIFSGTLTVSLALMLNNVMNFDILVKRVTLGLQYDDPGGSQLWYYPTKYNEAFNIDLVSNLPITDSVAMSAGAMQYSPAVNIPITENKGQHLTRLYDQVCLGWSDPQVIINKAARSLTCFASIATPLPPFPRSTLARQRSASTSRTP